MGDAEDVISIEKQWPDRLSRRDRPWLEAHTTDDFVFITASGDLLSRQEYLDRSEAGNPAIVARTNLTDRAVVVGDCAVLIGRLHVRMRDAQGGESLVHHRYSSVYVRSDGVWRTSSAQLTSFEDVAGSAG